MPCDVVQNAGFLRAFAVVLAGLSRVRPLMYGRWIRWCDISDELGEAEMARSLV
jgi:hypothetical protein